MPEAVTGAANSLGGARHQACCHRVTADRRTGQQPEPNISRVYGPVSFEVQLDLDSCFCPCSVAVEGDAGTLIEETARHASHADILREHTDGATGFDGLTPRSWTPDLPLALPMIAAEAGTGASPRKGRS